MQYEESKNEDDPNEQIKVYSVAEIVDQIPRKVKRADELLNLDDDDQVIAILRFFSWNQLKLEENWFEQQE
jgi:hypothetical protein